MKFPRSKLITKIIVFALVVYAGISLISLRAQIEAGNSNVHVGRRAVAEQEIINAQLEHDIENHDSSDVRANIARSALGLELPNVVEIGEVAEVLDDDEE